MNNKFYQCIKLEYKHFSGFNLINIQIFTPYKILNNKIKFSNYKITKFYLQKLSKMIL